MQSLLSGPSSNPLSIYSTTNSTTFRPHALPPATHPSSAPPQTGFSSNLHSLSNPMGQLKGMEQSHSEQHDRFSSQTSLVGQLQEHSQLVSPNSPKRIHHQPGTTTGFNRNVKPPQSDPNLPSNKETTSRCIHSPQPLQREPSNPESIDEMRSSQCTTSLLSGGYSTNRINTLNINSSEREGFGVRAGGTVYQTSISGEVNDKFFHSARESVNHAPQLLSHAKSQHKHPERVLSTGYKHAEYPAQAISTMAEKQLAIQRKFDESLDPETLKELKLSDPIYWDDITQHRGQFDTTNRIAFSKRSSGPSLEETVRSTQASKPTTGPGSSDAKMIQRFNYTVVKKSNEPSDDAQKNMATGHGRNTLPPFQMKAERDNFETTYSKMHAKGGQKDTFLSKPPVAQSAFIREAPLISSNASLTDTLKSDHEEMKHFHPVIRRHLQHSEPATFGNAVPTYEHKKRRL